MRCSTFPLCLPSCPNFNLLPYLPFRLAALPIPSNSAYRPTLTFLLCLPSFPDLPSLLTVLPIHSLSAYRTTSTCPLCISSCPYVPSLLNVPPVPSLAAYRPTGTFPRCLPSYPYLPSLLTVLPVPQVLFAELIPSSAALHSARPFTRSGVIINSISVITETLGLLAGDVFSEIYHRYID